MPPIRLQRYLSQSGVSARRKAEDLITAGRVSVNGKVVDELGSKVDPKRDVVQVDGKTIEPEDHFYYLLNKPKGALSAVSDPKGRKTVMDFIPDDIPGKLKPVGRLDFNTEGVLLLTNDGALSAALQSPKSYVEKTYHVKVHGAVSEGHLKQLRKGVRLDDGYITRAAQVDRIKPKGETFSKHAWLVVTITEGKNRQVHRMFDSLGLRVMKLARVAYGGIAYFGLKVGDARKLTDQEVKHLWALVGEEKEDVPVKARRDVVPASAKVRGPVVKPKAPKVKPASAASPPPGREGRRPRSTAPVVPAGKRPRRPDKKSGPARGPMKPKSY